MTDHSGNKFGYISTFNFTWITAVVYAVGAAGHLIGQVYPMMILITPWFLALSALSVLYPWLRAADNKVIIWAAALFIFTFLAEAAGTATGKIFGSYIYGETLGLKILAVPPVIAVNWVIVTAGIIFWAEKITSRIYFTVLITAAGAVLFDFIMEPSAIYNNYWTWKDGIIPVQNYLAWAIIAGAAAFFRKLLKTENRAEYPGILVIVQFCFFLVLRISYLF